MLHLCNGAANIKHILVPSVSFSSPNGGTVSSTILLVEQC